MAVKKHYLSSMAIVFFMILFFSEMDSDCFPVIGSKSRMTNKNVILKVDKLGIAYRSKKQQSYIFQKGNVVYDFTFAELTVKYLETEDSTFLYRIAELKATEHLLKHAIHFNYSIPKSSKMELVKHLILPVQEKKTILDDFKRNLIYAKNKIAQFNLAEVECLKYLPDGFQYSSVIYFTFGYDLGVVYGPNASVNLAHPYYLKNMKEIKYYAIHELHHAGFVMLKKNFMPSLEITNYDEMAQLIEYYTHLEGMGTFAPLAVRKRENAMNIDEDYVALQDPKLMEKNETEFFEIYFHFKNNPDGLLTEKDWALLSVLSNKKRLWYRVGAKMAQAIEMNFGRKTLVRLISEPSIKFITTYLRIKSASRRKI